MSENLTFRIFEKDDINGVLRLWKEESGWGEITEEQFYKWYVNTPFGECLTIVAVNSENEIVGQEAFVPSRILINGVEKTALRFFAPILSKSLRLGAGSPMRDMFKFGMNIAVQRGFSLVYAFPAFVFFRIMKFLTAPEINPEPPQNTALDCYSLNFREMPKIKIATDLSAGFVSEFNKDFDDLWQDAKESFPIKCGIVRDSQWLNWKLGGRATIEVRNDENKLIGYVSIDKKSSLMVDALARSPQELDEVIGTAIKKIAQSAELNFAEIKIMQTAITQNAIERYGFSKIDFRFAFWRYSIDPSISAETLDLADWYVMPND